MAKTATATVITTITNSNSANTKPPYFIAQKMWLPSYQEKSCWVSERRMGVWLKYYESKATRTPDGKKNKAWPQPGHFSFGVMPQGGWGLYLPCPPQLPRLDLSRDSSSFRDHGRLRLLLGKGMAAYSTSM